MTYIQTDMTHEETRLRAQVAGLSEAAHDLLDAMHMAERAKGIEEKDDARWEVTTRMDELRAALAQGEP